MQSQGIKGEIFEVCRRGGHLCLEWRIHRFLDLPCQGYEFWESPRFSFHDACWFMQVCPNFLSLGNVQFSLHRCDEVPSTKTILVSVGLKGSDGGEDKRREQEVEFDNEDCWFLRCFCLRGELIEQRRRHMQDDALVILCQMEIPVSTARDASSQTEAEFKESRIPLYDKESSEKRGFEKVHEDFANLLASGERSDVTLQVGDIEFNVHSAILFARCPALSMSLQHESKEKASNRIFIEDCDPDVFQDFLYHLYTGSVKALTEQTVFGLYRVADKYLVDDLRAHCLEYMQDTLSVQTFCDSMKLALRHGERGLLQKAIDFATNNIQSVVCSVEWQNFIREYPIEANEIFIKSLTISNKKNEG